MIPWDLIFLAAGITTLVVIVAAKVMSWSIPASLATGLAAAAGVIVWRAAANALDLNGDVFSLVSPGDLGCLIAGAIGPGVVSAVARSKGTHCWLLVSIAGVAAFVANVVVL